MTYLNNQNNYDDNDLQKTLLIPKSKKLQKVLLIILDGFGISNEAKNNAIANANKPNWDYYTNKYAYNFITASGIAVGLPCGQFGNSEVGHLNIGAGRIIEQSITRIDKMIADDSFAKHEVLTNLSNNRLNNTVHIMGLLSDGGVHAHYLHIFALIAAIHHYINITHIYLHVFLDGRDTPPKSAIQYLELLQNFLIDYPKVIIATINGRYYAMDRDNRIDRVKLTYDAIINAKIDGGKMQQDNIIAIIENAYNNGITDEFIKPIVIGNYHGVCDGDSIIFANFRKDRVIQLTKAILDNQFNYQDNKKKLSLGSFITMTEYFDDPRVKVLFPAMPIHNTLGSYLSQMGLTQLRITETEKYPHVTYFFNGGEGVAYPNETRIMIDSPKTVATYDLQPEMSLMPLTDELIVALNSNRYDFIVTNFANGDMVGHTGNLNAAIKAVEAIDVALGKCIQVATNNDYEIIITADHGNCEIMYDELHHQAHTQHTTNLVPLLYIGQNATIDNDGSLKDIAPTILALMNLDIPQEMTGKNLIHLL